MPKGKNSFNFLNQFIIVVAYFELEILLPTNRNSNFDILKSKVDVIYFCNTKQTKNNFFIFNNFTSYFSWHNYVFFLKAVIEKEAIRYILLKSLFIKI